MARKLKSDKLLFLAILLLVCTSVVMVYSASAVLAMDQFDQPYFFLFRQAVWIVLGMCLLLAASHVDYRRLRHSAVIWTVLAVTVAALIAVLFGTPINGTRRWLGIAGFGVQPSEFAKLAAILFAAAILERRMHRIDDVGYSLLPVTVMTGVISALILLEPDFGTALVLMLIVGAMVFAAGLSYRYLIGVTAALLPLLYVVLTSAEYRRRRVLAFLNPWDDPLGDGFQLIQAQIAVGTGGVFGQGLMAGVQKLFYLPYPHTDFIYAVIAEETGLIGASIILLCFCVIAWRGFRVAALAPDRFGVLLAVGLTTMVALQAFVNISVGAWPPAHQGDSAAARQLWRIVVAGEPGGHGDPAEHFAARGGGNMRCAGEPGATVLDVERSGPGPVCRRRHGRASVSRHRGRVRAAPPPPGRAGGFRRQRQGARSAGAGAGRIRRGSHPYARAGRGSRPAACCAGWRCCR